MTVYQQKQHNIFNINKLSIINEIKRSFKKGEIYTKLIYINIGAFVAVFFLSLFFPIDEWLSVPGNFKKLIYRPWSPISYMFVHGGFIHLLSNVLWLYWFGKLFINYLNRKQFLAVYLLGGIVGAFLHLLVNELTGGQAGLIGASGAVMAIVFAVSAYKPDHKMYLVFIGAVKLKYIALVAFVIDLMGVASDLKGLSDGVAHFAHLGGAGFGLWFGYEIRKGKDITKSFNLFLDTLVTMLKPKHKGHKNNMKVTKNNKFTRKNEVPRSDMEYNASKADDQEELNRILDQISKSGYDSLSKKDKNYLFNRKK